MILTDRSPPSDESQSAYRSLVDPRVRALMYSRTADSGYRTARPTLTNRGPSPDSRALASQDNETFKILATSRGWRSGSIVLALVGAFITVSSMHRLTDPSAFEPWKKEAGERLTMAAESE